MLVTIQEHEDSVSLFYDEEWKLTLGCEEAHVAFVHDTLFKWATNISKGRVSTSPVWQLILGGIVTWYSDEPGEEFTHQAAEEDEPEA